MTIDYRNGNLMEVPSGHIVHGCNARGVMGSGVALQIKNKWPSVYQDYRQAFQEQGLRLGDVQPVVVSPELVVWNAITQKTYGSGPHRYVDYEAIARCFEKINTLVSDYPDVEQKIHIPKIGAGLAGGDWPAIAAIIDSVVNVPVIVWVYP